MKAAVVESFSQSPRYTDFDEPKAQSDEVIVSVRAAALSQLVRAQASGRHYSSGKPPLVPGADGVGTLENGQRVYFAFPRAPIGSMAERTVVKQACTVPLPDELDDVTVAAMANPGMSSWAALKERAGFQAGESVLVNGATGASGRLAIQIARHLGAKRVVATGRRPESEPEMRALGADAFICIDVEPDQLRRQFEDTIAAGVDVVLDYVWGPSAATFMQAATRHGEGEAAPRIRFVNIGNMAGPEINLPASFIRSSGLSLMGSGLGSVSNAGLVESIASMLKVAKAIGLEIETTQARLADVADAWQWKTDKRVVLTV